MKIDSRIYHADMCCGIATSPSVSNSIIRVMLQKSPKHAMLAHPRLNPYFVPDEDKSIFDVGTAAHALLLEGVDKMSVIDAEDWRTKAAKEARDEARAIGKIPVLPHQYAQICAMRDAAMRAISACNDLSGLTMADGEAEETICWTHGKTQCRARLDWVSHDRQIILDYKTTAMTPDAWMRAIGGSGYDIQESWYRQAVRSTYKVDAKFIFVVQETSEPYSVWFVGLSPSWQEIGDQKVDLALSEWASCMKSGVWPGYDQRIRWAEAPGWALADAEEKLSERDSAGYGKKMIDFDRDAPGSKESFLFGAVKKGK